ncbi:MAG: hypothetical protein H8E32_15730 [Nitrospinae bacterium]|nr:hypothetical protein [Nitrospinota bacterium]
MDEKVFQTIKDLISTKTGIQVKDESENELAQKISVRMKYLKLSHPFEYQQILKANGVTSEIEWKELITFITIGESYFFRDKGQIDLLKTSILPEIIEKRKADRKLRIWSAGCSTGEEPYSLAILLNELLPKNENWNLYLLGTDINEEALMKARKGFFTSWSFRGVNPLNHNLR